MRKIFYSSLAFLVIILIWLIGSFVVDNELVLPTISDTIKALTELFKSKSFYANLGASLLRLIISVLISFVLSIIIVSLSMVNSKFGYFIKPFMTFFRVIPLVSIVLIILLLFGFKIAPFIIVSLLLIPNSYETILSGYYGIDQEMIDVFKIESNSKFDLVSKVYLPFLSSPIRSSLIESIGLGFKVLVMAEYLAQVNKSYGNALYEAKTYLETDKLFALSIVLIILCFLIEIPIKKMRSN